MPQIRCNCLWPTTALYKSDFSAVSLYSVLKNLWYISPTQKGTGSPKNNPHAGVDNYAAYNGMAVAADQVFGNLTATLKAMRVYNNTLIIVTSDNGGPASTIVSGHAGNNFPHRGKFSFICLHNSTMTCAMTCYCRWEANQFRRWVLAQLYLPSCDCCVFCCCLPIMMSLLVCCTRWCSCCGIRWWRLPATICSRSNPYRLYPCL